MLLARHESTPLRAVERLGGMQAQLARPPYIGLWSRLADFDRGSLTRALTKRQIVRATLMRGTLHLMSARDYVAFRGALQPMLTAGMRSVLRDRAKGLELDRVLAAARRRFAEGPRTFEVLRDELLREFPRQYERAMGYAARMHLPLVQVPDGGAWGYPGVAEFCGADTWLGKAVPVAGEPGPLVLRYLAAFGPATVADAQEWSGLAGLAPTFESLRRKLVTFSDDRGRELFDLPRAPRPPETVAAPVRFIPEFDNLVLAHADRRRVVDDAHRKRISTANLRVLAAFLVDGFVAGTWRIERKKQAAALVLEPLEKLSARARAELVSEGGRLLSFVEPDAATHGVRLG